MSFELQVCPMCGIEVWLAPRVKSGRWVDHHFDLDWRDHDWTCWAVNKAPRPERRAPDCFAEFVA